MGVLPLIKRLIAILAPSATMVLVQLAAILGLTAADYGIFALFYIVVAVGSAGVYSLVSEAWVGELAREEDWGDYSAVLVTLCIAAFAASIALGLLSDRFILGLFFAIAVSCSLYRLGARYFVIYCGRRTGVVRADIASIVLTGCALWLVPESVPWLMTLAMAWALGASSSVVLSKRPQTDYRFVQVNTWFKQKWPRVRVLGGDSLLIELGQSGVPLFLAPQMGLANFGVYRAVSSAGVPVRVVLNPLRPNIAKQDTGRLVAGRNAAINGMVGLAMGIGITAALHVVERTGMFSGTAVSALAQFKIGVGLFVASHWFDTFFYLAMRSRLGGRAIFGYRLMQLVLNISAPLIGFYVGGLGGAVWGYVVANMLVSPVAFIILRSSLYKRW